MIKRKLIKLSLYDFIVKYQFIIDITLLYISIIIFNYYSINYLTIVKTNNILNTNIFNFIDSLILKIYSSQIIDYIGFIIIYYIFYNKNDNINGINNENKYILLNFIIFSNFIINGILNINFMFNHSEIYKDIILDDNFVILLMIINNMYFAIFGSIVIGVLLALVVHGILVLCNMLNYYAKKITFVTTEISIVDGINEL